MGTKSQLVKTPVTDAQPCAGILARRAQPPELGAMPSEGIQGDKWDSYVALERMSGTNVGSPTGREPYGDTGPILVVELRPTKESGRAGSRAEGPGDRTHDIRAACEMHIAGSCWLLAEWCGLDLVRRPDRPVGDLVTAWPSVMLAWLVTFVGGLDLHVSQNQRS